MWMQKVDVFSSVKTQVLFITCMNWTQFDLLWENELQKRVSLQKKSEIKIFFQYTFSIDSRTMWIFWDFILKTLCSSCSVSPSTVEIVENCPHSEEKWKEAAARKNCSAYANQCDAPGRLKYHCVINTFVNVTLEVCAYGKEILLGHCTEYSQSGNRIQESFRTNCRRFTQNPCPIGYHSTEAYKYPGCYDMTNQKKNQATTETTQPSPKDSTTVPNKNMSSHLESTSLPMVCLLLICAAIDRMC